MTNEWLALFIKLASKLVSSIPRLSFLKLPINILHILVVCEINGMKTLHKWLDWISNNDSVNLTNLI